MKKIKMITLVFFFIFMLSGCVESTTKMTIDKNKKVTVEATYLIENNYYDESYFDLSKYEKNGKTVEKVNAEEYSGFKVTKKYNSIDDISDSVGKEVYLSDFLGEEFDDSILFKVEKGFFKNIYTAKFKYDTTNADEGLENIESNDYDNSVNNNDIVLNDEDQTDVDNSYLDNPDVDLSQLQESLLKMKFEYILNLPVKSDSNNATTVSEDGKTLTWTITANKVSDIDFSISLMNMNNIYIAVGGALALIVIIIVIVVIIKSKKNKSLIPNDVPIHADYDSSIAGATLPNGTNIGNIDTINTMPYGGVLDNQQSPVVDEQPVENHIINNQFIQNQVESSTMQETPIISEQTTESPYENSQFVQNPTSSVNQSTSDINRE